MIEDTVESLVPWLDPQSLKRFALVCRGWSASAGAYAVSLEYGQALVWNLFQSTVRHLISLHVPSRRCNAGCEVGIRSVEIAEHVSSAICRLAGIIYEEFDPAELQWRQLLDILYYAVFVLRALDWPLAPYALEWCARVEHRVAPDIFNLREPRREYLALLYPPVEAVKRLWRQACETYSPAIKYIAEVARGAVNGARAAVGAGAVPSGHQMVVHGLMMAAAQILDQNLGPLGFALCAVTAAVQNVYQPRRCLEEVMDYNTRCPQAPEPTYRYLTLVVPLDSATLRRQGPDMCRELIRIGCTVDKERGKFLEFVCSCSQDVPGRFRPAVLPPPVRAPAPPPVPDDAAARRARAGRDALREVHFAEIDARREAYHAEISARRAALERSGEPLPETFAAEAHAAEMRRARRALRVARRMMRAAEANRPEGVPAAPARPEGAPARPEGAPARPEGAPARPEGAPARPEGAPARPEGAPAAPGDG